MDISTLISLLLPASLFLYKCFEIVRYHREEGLKSPKLIFLAVYEMLYTVALVTFLATGQGRWVFEQDIIIFLMISFGVALLAIPAHIYTYKVFYGIKERRKLNYRLIQMFIYIFVAMIGLRYFLESEFVNG